MRTHARTNAPQKHTHDTRHTTTSARTDNERNGRAHTAAMTFDLWCNARCNVRPTPHAGAHAVRCTMYRVRLSRRRRRHRCVGFCCVCLSVLLNHPADCGRFIITHTTPNKSRRLLLLSRRRAWSETVSPAGVVVVVAAVHRHAERNT